jgi:formylglycine-generating enzyme required for sulfatase activity
VQDYAAFVKETQRDWPEVDFAQGPTHPAVNVSWEDAHAFCAWLTFREFGTSKVGAPVRYRLPIDYEWSCAVGLGRLEKVAGTPAAKSGKVKDVYPWGTQWPPPKGAGNYLPSVGVDNFEKTSPVGSFAANAYGLYDMGGNVWQWCEDRWKKDDFRALRGGSWFNFDAPSLLSSARINRDKTERYDETCGFRCVLVVEALPAVPGYSVSPSPGKKR